jgi:short-subunit dehydrogenase
MKEQKNGFIINIGSTRAITSAPGKSLYSMSKFALRSMTQSINIEYNKEGIYSTLICPGAIDKEGTDKTKVQYNDVINTVKYLLTVPISASVPEIILGGQL